MDAEVVVPDWPAPERVHALVTTRALGDVRSEDGRQRLRERLPSDPVWLRQVHGVGAVNAASVPTGAEADASFTNKRRVVCAVMAADCMPVLLAEERGEAVGVAHAGWRGLAAGVLQQTARTLLERLQDPRAELRCYLGPAIGPQRFEVGAEVLEAMRARLPQAGSAFVPLPSGKYLCDLFALARMALAQVGIDRVSGGGVCTYSDARRFYSFRRDRETGRHAALIWMAS